MGLEKGLVWSRAWQYFHKGIFEESWVSPGLPGWVMPLVGGMGFTHQLPRSFQARL